MATVFLGLGANMGQREANLQRALERLSRHGKVERLSSFYETEPVGYLTQPCFLNAACRFSTPLSPQSLLGVAKDIERELGRQPSPTNFPRPMDIDILFYDDLILNSENLTVPHPRLSQRAFVLVPLAEIAPDLVHPELGKQVKELLSQVDTEGVRLWKGIPRLRGHHLMCLIGFRGYGYSEIHRERLAEMQHQYLTQSFAAMELVQGADDICAVCPWLREQRCFLDEEEKEAKVREKDALVLERIGLRPGSYLWGEVLQRVQASIKVQDLANLCAACSWLPLGFCEEGWQKLGLDV